MSHHLHNLLSKIYFFTSKSNTKDTCIHYGNYYATKCTFLFQDPLRLVCNFVREKFLTKHLRILVYKF